MPKSGEATAKTEQFLVRVSEEQADFVEALRTLENLDSAAALLRWLLEEAATARADDKLLWDVVARRASKRAEERRQGVRLVDEASS